MLERQEFVGAKHLFGLGAAASGHFLSIFGIAHFPAERRDLIAQFITFPPIFGKPRLRSRFGQRSNFGRRSHSFCRRSPERCRSAPTIRSHWRASGGVKCAVHPSRDWFRELSRTETPSAAGNIQIIIERFFKSSVGVDVGRRRSASACELSRQPLQPIIDPCQRLPRLLHSFPGEVQRHAVMHPQ